MNLLAFGKAAAAALASSYKPIRKYICFKKNEVFLFVDMQYKEKRFILRKLNSIKQLYCYLLQ